MREATNKLYDAKLHFAAAIMQTDNDEVWHHRQELRTSLSVEDCPNRRAYVDGLLKEKGIHLSECSGQCKCDWHGTRWCNKAK